MQQAERSSFLTEKKNSHFCFTFQVKYRPYASMRSQVNIRTLLFILNMAQIVCIFDDISAD
jgi:hypothetical protein